jgi:tetratricopeptide (TPR) repeat protein
LQAFSPSRLLRMSDGMWMTCVRRERRKAVWACLATTITLTVAPAALAQSNSIGAARELYAAAAYDDALTVLNDLRGSDRRDENGRIEYYRALCLLAVGRATEAEAAIEAAVTAEPFAQPADTETSPHVRLAFREVRRRVLPAIIERKYADAKTAFGRKDSTAAQRFTEVVALIDDPDIQSLRDQPALSQVRALAADYLTLSLQRQSRE